MTTISAEREKEAQKYSEDMRDTFSQIVGDGYKIERAFIAGCENEARNPIEAFAEQLVNDAKTAAAHLKTFGK